MPERIDGPTPEINPLFHGDTELPDGRFSRLGNILVDRDVPGDRFGAAYVVDQVVRPDGSDGEQRHLQFHNPAVMVFGMDELDPEANVYLHRGPRYGLGEITTEGAGSIIRDGETPETAAVRTASGLGIDLVTPTLLSPVPVDEISGRVQNRTYKVVGKAGTVHEIPEQADGSERLVYPLPQALQMVRSGEITNAVTRDGLRDLSDLLQAKTSGATSRRIIRRR